MPASTTSATGQTTATQTTSSTTSSSRSSGGSTNVRVPATFVIGPGGKLVPPSISAPAFLAVALSVASGDGRQHHVLLKTPSPHSLTVPAHGRASVLVPGLRAGQYQIEVDGTTRGLLSIGGEPGP